MTSDYLQFRMLRRFYRKLFPDYTAYAKKVIEEDNKKIVEETRHRYEFLSLLGEQQAILDKLNQRSDK